MTDYEIKENGDLRVFVIDNEQIAECDDLYEALEKPLCNGLDTVLPEDIGALTNSIILTDGDNENLTVEDNIWWSPNYMLVNELKELQENGEYIFTKA